MNAPPRQLPAAPSVCTDDLDADAVRRCREGDAEAFGELVERYERVVFGLVQRMVRERDEAAEITQVVFVRAFEKLGTFDPRYRFFSWLYRIAINQALNHRQSRRRFTELDSGLRSAGPGADAACVQAEMTAHLHRALEALTDDYRVVVILRHFVLLSYREIGEVLGLPEKTVKSRLYSGRQLLRDQLVRQGWAG
jgi:RNA polymerase sigma-70 factor, ECF subfamily